MAAYLLDTNHASPLVTLNHPLRTQVRDALRKGSTFAICVPVLTETLFGIGILPRAKQNQAEWQVWQSLFTCYVPDETDAFVAAESTDSAATTGAATDYSGCADCSGGAPQSIDTAHDRSGLQVRRQLEIQNWLQV